MWRKSAMGRATQGSGGGEMARLRLGGGQALLVGAGIMAGLMAGADGASAQSTFCPASLPTVDIGTFGLDSGRCTNGLVGAFSGAALGSQSLSDLASGSTETTNRAASGMINERRQGAQFSCPAGTVRSGGQCLPVQRPQTRADSQLPSRTRVPAAVRARSEAAPAPARKRTVTRVVTRGGKTVRVRVAEPVAAGPYEQAPLVAVPAFVEAELAPRWGVFAQGYGDYEERTGRSGSTMSYPGIAPIPITILTKSNTTSMGFVGGIDYTTRGLFSSDDGLIFGVLGGYSESEVKISSRILSTDPSLLGDGYSSLRARATGGSVGAFATYFTGPLSVDALYKVDFYNLNESFTDLAAFTLAGSTVIAGAGSTSLTNHSLVGNINYRIPLSGSFWLEPTAGIQARWVDYASSAAQLGLANGHLLRIQGGARLGWDFDYAGIKITPIITGLAYSDVTVTGGFVEFGQGGGFGATSTQLGVSGTSVINIRQQGLLRGQGILTVVADFGNGWSGFVQGDVRGGKDLFGAGGKGGIRYQW